MRCRCADAPNDPQPRLEGPRTVDVDAGEVANVPVTLAVTPPRLDASPFDVRFEVCDAARHCDAERSDFFGPARRIMNAQ